MAAIFLKANAKTVRIPVRAVSPDSSDSFDVEFLRHSIAEADELLNEFNKLQRVEMGAGDEDLTAEVEADESDELTKLRKRALAARININKMVKANVHALHKLQDADNHPVNVVRQYTPLDEAINAADASSALRSDSKAADNDEVLLADVLDEMLNSACYRVGLMNGFLDALINLGDEVRRKN